MNNTVIFPPIHSGFDDQLYKAINEEPQEQATQRARKIQFTIDHLDQITHVNGKEVFMPSVEGERLFFFLTDPKPLLDKLKLPIPTRGTHYYPIQYAEITFTNND